MKETRKENGSVDNDERWRKITSKQEKENVLKEKKKKKNYDKGRRRTRTRR